ncbi:MAG: hypothetical protein K1W26_09610 [Acetatifactor sp.]
MDKNRIVKNSKFWAATVTVAACVALSACSDVASSNRVNTTAVLSEDIDSSEPGNAGNARPESVDSTKPEIANSVKSESADSSKPEIADSVRSESADSSEPENTDSVKLESTESTKLENTDSAKLESAEPQNADNAKPESINNSELGSADNAKLESADSSEPGNTDNTESESADSAESEKIEIPDISTGYPEYDALLSQVQKVLVDPDCYLTEELEDRFSFTFYFLAFYQDYDSPGYILLDLDGNGTEELILGENGGGAWDGVIFDIYTVVDGELNHVFAGGERNQCHLCEDGTIAYECTNGASDSAHIYYTYEAAELKMIEAVHYYEDGIYYSTEHSFTGYLIGEIEPETYRKYEWEEEDREEVEKIHEKYVYGPIPFNRLIVTSQEK